MGLVRPRRTVRVIPFLIVVCFVILPAQAQYSGGSGTADDPYQIATADDLIALGETPDDYDKHFILTADIDLDPNLPGGKVFDRAVIAPDTNDWMDSWQQCYFDGTQFTGVFDGNHHTVSHLTIVGGGYLGLFGQGCGDIKNVGVANVNIVGLGGPVAGLIGFNVNGTVMQCYNTGTVSGDSYVGGLVGDNRGSIITSYSTGLISGDWYVGGLVGRNNGSITSSYSTGSVTGSGFVIGGLAGYNDGSITSSYSTGLVRGTGGAVSSVGGLVGSNYRGSITSSFWDIETSGQSSSSGGTGLTTTEMQKIQTYIDGGWDLVGETVHGLCDFWVIQEGTYPSLAVLSGILPVEPNGSGTQDDPYLLTNANDLGTVWHRPWACYRLEADIDLSGITCSSAVVPVFGGAFDGNGHIISNLNIDGGGFLGFFGQCSSGAVISHLGLEAVDVNGTNDRVGGLVGRNGGSITLSYSTGSVSGDAHVGGLVGRNHGDVAACYCLGAVVGSGNYVGGLIGDNTGCVAASYSSASVDGSADVGGLVGANDWSSDASISNCHSTGRIHGEWRVGGLVGTNSWATITASYSTGAVAGDHAIGGLVGENWRGTILASYSMTTVTGHSSVGGLVGSDIHGALCESYSLGSVTGDEWVGGLIGDQSADDFLGGLDMCSVVHCYSAARVQGDTDTAGLIGSAYKVGVIITGSFWDIQTSGQTTSEGGTGKTTAEMQTASTFLEAGWDFVDETDNGPNDIWKIVEGQTYPLLSWQKYGGGTGEPNDPYLIYTAEHLNALGAEPNDYDKHFKLMADIDLSEYAYDRAVIAPDVNDAIDSLGNLLDGTPFSGVFDGGGHTISHLTIEGKDYLGLFGFLESRYGMPHASIKDLGIVDVNVIASGSCVGGLVGENSRSSIVESYSTGSVSGTECVGGLAGRSMSYTDLRECYSTATVTGSGAVGGLVGGIGRSWVEECFGGGPVNGNVNVGGLAGWASQTFIANSYSTGAVSGYSRVGGLVGGLGLEGGVSFCYSTGVVSGNDNVGGLVGAGASTWNRESGSVDGCFWDTQTSGCVLSYGDDGGTGKTTAEMQTASTFLEAGWDFIDETENGTDDIWWILEGQDYPRLWWEHVVWFPDYMPLDPNEHGIKIFEWIYGESGAYVSEIGDLETVPYASGALTGVQIINFSGWGRPAATILNDGASVKFLAAGSAYISADTTLGSHPSVYSFGALGDGDIIDVGIYWLRKDSSEWESDEGIQLLIDIQDVTVPAGVYNDAVIMWWIDTKYSFVPLAFHGMESELGITLPTGSDLRGRSVTDFDIFSRGVGLIAHGGVDAAEGTLTDLAVMKQVD